MSGNISSHDGLADPNVSDDRYGYIQDCNTTRRGMESRVRCCLEGNDRTMAHTQIVPIKLRSH